jgi:hypothetical protein
MQDICHGSCPDILWALYDISITKSRVLGAIVVLCGNLSEVR